MVIYYPHTPVMLRPCVEALVKDSSGVYVDGTLGGGGHSVSILDALSTKGKLFGVDQDSQAHEAAMERIGKDSRFIPVLGNFGYLPALLPPETIGRIDGLLLDLGVSTHQIKSGERGFSFQEDGPLDMRMGNLQGLSAYEVVNSYTYEALRDIIFHYGEERASKKISRAIIDSRPVETTGELASVIRKITPAAYQVKTLARVFQGIRIEVNGELDALKKVLADSIELLKPGGRLVVMAYHSLEDRLVKRFIKSGNVEGKVEKDFFGNVLRPFVPVGGVIRPDAGEVAANPAARSAKLRIAERFNGGAL